MPVFSPAFLFPQLLSFGQRIRSYDGFSVLLETEREIPVDPSHLGSALCGSRAWQLGFPRALLPCGKNMYASARYKEQHPKELLLLFC